MRRHLGWALTSIVSLGFGGADGALAADMAVKARPPIPVVAAYNWTGCYIGVEGGGSWGRSRSVSNGSNNGVANGTLGVLKNETDISGGIAGGTLGCNYQVNRWVFGIEGDYSWSNERGSSLLIPPFNTTFQENISQSYFATVRGRVGYTFSSFLFYGTAGAAFADLRINEFSINNPANSAVETHNYSGWTAGVGLEYGFAGNWSVKGEYLYVDLGKQDVFATTLSSCCTFQNSHLTDNIFRVGVNYRFNLATPVVAKY